MKIIIALILMVGFCVSAFASEAFNDPQSSAKWSDSTVVVVT